MFKIVWKMAGTQAVDTLHFNVSPTGRYFQTGFIKINGGDRASRGPWEGSVIHQNTNLKRE